MWHRAKAPSVLPEELSQGATVPSLCSRTAPEVVEGAGKGEEEEEHVCTEPPGWRGWAEHPGVHCLGGPCPAPGVFSARAWQRDGLQPSCSRGP